MRFVFLASLFLAAACAPVGPDFVRPDAPVNPDWLQAELDEFESSPPELADWWRMLEDPVLNDLIDTAIQNNNNLRIAGLRVITAQANLGIATGNKYPQAQALVGDASVVNNGNLTLRQSSLGA